MQQDDLQLVVKLVFIGSTTIVATVALGVVAIASIRMWRAARRADSLHQDFGASGISAKETPMANGFVHVELNTTDVNKAKEFYGQLFDWDLEDVQMEPVGSYTTIKPRAGTGGGMLKQMMPGQPSFWLAYVEVGDIADSTARAKSLGARIMVDGKKIGDIGWLSIIVDPTGAMLGLWKPKTV